MAGCFVDHCVLEVGKRPCQRRFQDRAVDGRDFKERQQSSYLCPGASCPKNFSSKIVYRSDRCRTEIASNLSPSPRGRRGPRQELRKAAGPTKGLTPHRYRTAPSKILFL